MWPSLNTAGSHLDAQSARKIGLETEPDLNHIRLQSECSLTFHVAERYHDLGSLGQFDVLA